MDIQARARELRGIVSALRSLVCEATNDVFRLNKAGHYLQRAMNVGAFRDPEWVQFRTDSQLWARHQLSFVSAADWMLRNGPALNIEVNQSKGNGDLSYWCLKFAELIEAEAARVETQYAKEIATQHSPRRNWWKFANDWWQHNPIATFVVLGVGVVTAFRGLFAFFVNDLAALYQLLAG